MIGDLQLMVCMSFLVLRQWKRIRHAQIRDVGFKNNTEFSTMFNILSKLPI